MKQIESSHDLAALLQTERAIVFIFFPWSDRSVQSQKIVNEWQRQINIPGCPIFQLVPDRHPFTWQWLDMVFSDAPEQKRTCGMVVWMRRGSVAAIVPDAAAAGIEMLARVTNDCIVLGKTHTESSVALLQSEPAPFDANLLKILCCPETHQALALADTAVLDKLNERFMMGRLQNRAGQPIREKIEDGLVRADGRLLYPLRRNIPILLVDEAIPL
jgi:uncharacterized protein YbaR (Trm112 family)